MKSDKMNVKRISVRNIILKMLWISNVAIAQEMFLSLYFSFIDFICWGLSTSKLSFQILLSVYLARICYY